MLKITFLALALRGKRLDWEHFSASIQVPRVGWTSQLALHLFLPLSAPQAEVLIIIHLHFKCLQVLPFSSRCSSGVHSSGVLSSVPFLNLPVISRISCPQLVDRLTIYHATAGALSYGVLRWIH